MRKTDVPQEEGLFDGARAVCYAIDEAGRYVLAPTAGWEVVNVACWQAWEVIREEVDAVLARIAAGKASPLAFYMTLRMMNAGLVAQYMGLRRWTVRRHMKPKGFAALDEATLARYAGLFEITVAQLCRVPDKIVLPGEEDPDAPQGARS